MQTGENEWKTLKRNTVIIAISNIGSKAISFIMAPVYSYYLTTEQYGIMDLISTICILILPILCLDIYEAVFRYANDNCYSKDTIISTSLAFVMIESFFFIFVLILSSAFISVPSYILISLLYAEIDSFYQVVNQFARGSNKMKPFAISGIVNSVVMLLSNILLVVILKYGLTGWIISFFISKIIAFGFIFFNTKVWRIFSIKSISKSYLIDSFKYCIPLLPTAIMWWVMNLSDRFFIVFYLGIAANGIYAVASKIPSILSVFENIFFQSWQTSAINTINSADRDSFISSIFEKYTIVLTVGVLTVLTVLSPIISIFSDQYHDAWMSSGILVIAIMIHALGGNLGAIYTAQKRTTYALYTSMTGAIINILLNFLLIPRWGLMAAAVTTLTGYLVVLFLRYIHLSRSLKFSVKKGSVLLSSFLIIIQTLLYYWNSELNIMGMIIVLCFGLYIFRETIFAMLRKL